MDEFEWPHWPHRERHHESTGIANGEIPKCWWPCSHPSAEVHLNLNPFFWHAEIKFNLDFQTYRSWFCRILILDERKWRFPKSHGGIPLVLIRIFIRIFHEKKLSGYRGTAQATWSGSSRARRGSWPAPSWSWGTQMGSWWVYIPV